jgi:acetyltransferase-like isoleucine patch superfamily enzyme
LIIARAIKTARHLARTQGGSTWARLRSVTLINHLKSLIWRRDLISRFSFAWLDPRPGSFKHELKQLKHDLQYWMISRIMKFRWGSRRVGIIRARRARRRFQRWLDEINSSNCTIDRGIEFTGRPDGHSYLQVNSGVNLEREITIWISPDAGANPQLVIGEKAFVGRNTYLGVYQPIHIGKHVLIGAYSYIISSNHNIERRDIPINDQGSIGAPIIIEEGAWLGTHVVVLPGVKIGQGAVIGAGSVVTSNVPAWEIWGGVPARFIKLRPE